MMDKVKIVRAAAFVEACRLEPGDWRFSSFPGGAETLYATCFAVMVLHYLDQLGQIPDEDQQAWAEYINSWQQPDTGLFIGPELIAAEMNSRKHSYEHVAHHLTAHALPALDLLGSRPVYRLTFAERFTNPEELQTWLEARDWRDAWLEGNNLLFIGQFLLHLREIEKTAGAGNALDQLFDWLDLHVDPQTGLWGSNGFCSIPAAVYGGYHQLLLYYHEDREIQFAERLVDTVLNLQHADGGFHPAGGGGACEDVDAVDILVNNYKRMNYKRPQIRLSLRRAAEHILSTQMPDGGFVYRRDQPFIHMGVARTASEADISNLFPTWFRLHTLALIGEVLTDMPLASLDLGFNRRLSMGWHRPWEKSQHRVGKYHLLEERAVQLLRRGRRVVGPYASRIRRLKGLLLNALTRAT